MELTKEYFDSTIARLATKDDLGQFATKEDVTKQIDELARITQEGFRDILNRLDVRKDIYELKKEMQEVRQELHLA